MWALRKPSLTMALRDIPMLIAESEGSLTAADQTGLEELYRVYDSAQGKITQARHDQYDTAKANSIYGLYPKTYDSSKSPLKNIRLELMRDVDKCPYCGFGEPITLDHAQPKSAFKALSTCRLNLVPICWRCNNLKGADKHMFVNPYYQQYPANVRFFRASVQFEFGYFVISFFIDPSFLPPRLSAILSNQIQVIQLTRRLSKEVNSFIYDLLKSQEFYDEDLLVKIILQDMKNKSERDNGRNHWKTASLEALANSKALTIKNINTYLSKIASNCQPKI